jgi:hypothetical protein
MEEAMAHTGFVAPVKKKKKKFDSRLYSRAFQVL